MLRSLMDMALASCMAVVISLDPSEVSSRLSSAAAEFPPGGAATPPEEAGMTDAEMLAAETSRLTPPDLSGLSSGVDSTTKPSGANTAKSGVFGRMFGRSAKTVPPHDPQTAPREPNPFYSSRPLPAPSTTSSSSSAGASSVPRTSGIYHAHQTTNESVDHCPLAEEVREVLHRLGLGHVPLHIVPRADMRSQNVDRMLELYKAAPPTGLTLVVTSTFTGIALFAQQYPRLFRDKTVRVVHTGGALLTAASRGWAHGSSPDGVDNSIHDGSVHGGGDDTIHGNRTMSVLVPDPSAQNNKLDLEAAALCYRKCQSLSVPMVVLSRHVARACRLPRALFDVLNEHGGPIGARIYRASRDSFKLLWSRACAAADDPSRGQLPKRCNREWYLQTFCGGGTPPEGGSEGDDFDAVWPMVQSVNLYSPLALIAALPSSTFQKYLHTTPLTVRSATHYVVGITAHAPTLVEPLALRILFVQNLYSASLVNESEFTQGLPTPVPLIFDDDDFPPEDGILSEVTEWSFDEEKRDSFLEYIQTLREDKHVHTRAANAGARWNDHHSA